MERSEIRGWSLPAHENPDCATLHPGYVATLLVIYGPSLADKDGRPGRPNLAGHNAYLS